MVITEEGKNQARRSPYTSRQWTAGLERTIGDLGVPPSAVVVLGNQTTLPQSDPSVSPENTDDVQACSGRLSGVCPLYNEAEKKAAAAAGARMSASSVFCSSTCTAVIGKYEVYLDKWHITGLLGVPGTCAGGGAAARRST